MDYRTQGFGRTTLLITALSLCPIGCTSVSGQTAAAQAQAVRSEMAESRSAGEIDVRARRLAARSEEFRSEFAELTLGERDPRVQDRMIGVLLVAYSGRALDTSPLRSVFESLLNSEDPSVRVRALHRIPLAPRGLRTSLVPDLLRLIAATPPEDLHALGEALISAGPSAREQLERAQVPPRLEQWKANLLVRWRGMAAFADPQLQ